MFGKRVLFAGGLCVLLAGCAQPKYELGTENPDFDQKMQVSFNDEGLQMNWRWEKDPVGAEEGVILLRTYAPSPIDGFTVPADVLGDLSLTLWMPDMGHGSAPTRIERLKDAQDQIVPGAYRIRGIFFIMPGPWDLIFEIHQEGRLRDRAKVSVVRAS